jgi:hypothetical protein
MSTGAAFKRAVMMRLGYLQERMALVRTPADAALMLILVGEGYQTGHFLHASVALSSDQIAIDLLLRCAPFHARIAQPLLIHSQPADRPQSDHRTPHLRVAK